MEIKKRDKPQLTLSADIVHTLSAATQCQLRLVSLSTHTHTHATACVFVYRSCAGAEDTAGTLLQRSSPSLISAYSRTYQTHALFLKKKRQSHTPAPCLSFHSATRAYINSRCPSTLSSSAEYLPRPPPPGTPPPLPPACSPPAGGVCVEEEDSFFFFSRATRVRVRWVIGRLLTVDTFVGM